MFSIGITGFSKLEHFCIIDMINICIFENLKWVTDSELKTIVCLFRLSRWCWWERTHLPMQETWVWSLGGKEPLDEGMATHSSIFCLENPMDRGAWQVTVHGFPKSRTWLKWLMDTHLSLHLLIQESNPSLLHWQEDPLPLSLQGSPRLALTHF